MFIFSYIYLHIHDTYTITEMTVHDHTIFYTCIHNTYIYSALSLSSSSQLHHDMSTKNQQELYIWPRNNYIIVYLAVGILFSTTFSMVPDVELHLKDSGIIIYFSTLKISCG